MVIGSGLLARAFSPTWAQRDDVCVYAAGVSNSTCCDSQEFARERQRLSKALEQAKTVDAFVYFGTCSAMDPASNNTPYVQHKLAMEQLVLSHPCPLVLRLPQVAGRTPNPHTLLNFLYARITRSEAFTVWRQAKRNIIDVADVVAIADHLVNNQKHRNTIINIANPVSSLIIDIVAAMERAVGKQAVYRFVDRGAEYPIDVSVILPLVSEAGVKFGKNYLNRVTGKYYGKTQ